MDKMMNTAKKLDVVFKVIGIALSIAFVACFVGSGIIAIGLIFNLDPELIGTGYASISMGMAELEVAAGYAPKYKEVLLVVAAMLLLMTPICWIGKKCVLRIRHMLAPMKEGAPFHAAVGANLRKLSLYALTLGVVINCVRIVAQAFLVHGYQLGELLISEKISQVTFNYSFDLDFLLIASVLYLLSYVFRYGEELQRLSDETL